MRWLMLLLIMFGWGSSYVQRSALSVFAPTLRQELSLTNEQLGWAMSAMMFGIIAGCILMTIVTFVFGTRWGLTAAFAGASIAAVVSGTASGFAGLITARVLLGFFTGGVLPAAAQSVREWFPSRLRPLSLGLILASGQAAMALTPLLAASANPAIAWRPLLIATGLSTLIAAALCAIMRPPVQAREVSGGLPAPAIASTAMLAVGLFLAAPISYFGFGFLPLFLQQKLTTSLARLGTVSITATLAGLGGALLAGVAAWILMASGISASKTRAALLTIFGCLLPIAAFCGSTGTWGIIMLLLALSLIGYQAWSTLLYSAVADTLPTRGVAIGAAIGVVCVNLSGALSPVVFAGVNRNGNWNSVFVLLAILGIVALIGVGLLAWLVRQEPSSREDGAIEESGATETGAPPAEIGGWLILPAIGLILGPVVSVVFLIASLALFSQVAEAGHGGLHSFGILVQAGMLIFLIYAATLFFRKKRNAPVTMISLFVANIATSALLVLVSLASNAPEFVIEHGKGFAQSIIPACVWIPYFKVSKRVKVTFVN